MMNDWQVPETDQERLDVLRKIVHAGSCDFACSRFLLQIETLDAAKEQLRQYDHLLRVLHVAEGRTRAAREMLVHAVAHLERCVRECHARLPNGSARSRLAPGAGIECVSSRCEHWLHAAEELLHEHSVPRNRCSPHHTESRGAGWGPDDELLSILEQAVRATRQAHTNLTVTAETVRMVDASSMTIRLEIDALLRTAYRELRASLYQRPVARQREILAEYGLLASCNLAQPQPAYHLWK